MAADINGTEGWNGGEVICLVEKWIAIRANTVCIDVGCGTMMIFDEVQ